MLKERFSPAIMDLMLSLDCPVHIVPLEDGTHGYYSARMQCIYVNYEYFHTANVLDVIQTLFHEHRHYQQHKNNNNVFSKYVTAEECYSKYYVQFVEADARRYGYVATQRYVAERANKSVTNKILQPLMHWYLRMTYNNVRKTYKHYKEVS